MSEGLGLEELARLLSAPPRRNGNGVVVETATPQADLHRLLDLASERGLELADLEVRRPSLEDIFLELTRGEGEV